MDSLNSLHPDDQTLNDYGLGKLDDDSAGRVDDHLSGCDDCRQRVAGLTSDSFLGRLRQVHKPSPTSIPGGSMEPGTLSFLQGKTPSPPPSMDSLPLGLADHLDYEIKRELGRGGMGVVYLAHNSMLGRDEVLKVMGRHIMERPGVLERFQREIRAVARLRHPNIVAAYSAFRIEGGLVFAMEYVEGLDLARLVKAKGPLSVTHAAYFVHQAAIGLQHAHEKGMVHRDIKPHNLMLTSDGKARVVKVLDFGLAKATREQKIDAGLTSEGQALGTPDYIAPEQILNAVDVDIRADLYSLGGTLFYLLTGRPPFLANSLYDIYQAHISRDADPLNLIRPEVPSELAALVAKMMAKEPKRRFQTPGEVAEALKPYFRKPTATPSNPGSDALQSGLAVEARPVKGGVSTPTQGTTHAGRPIVLTRAGVEATGGGQTVESLIDLREPEQREGAEPAISESGHRSLRRTWMALAGLAFLVLMIALGVIIRTRTSDGGTLIVEVNEPGAVITVDKGPTTITWEASRKRAEIRMRPGEHFVEIIKDGFTSKNTRVSISEGGREVVTAILAPDSPPVDPVKPSDVSPLIAPDEPPPASVAKPMVAAALADRKANTVSSNPDDWQTEGEELVQTRDVGGSHPLLIFGDDKWIDYDFSFKAKLVKARATYTGLGVVFRSRSLDSLYRYYQAKENQCFLSATSFGKQDVELKLLASSLIRLNAWYSIGISVRGSHLSGTLSDGLNEFKIFDVEDDRHPNGRVGLMTHWAQCRFKDLKVTAPDGTVLWEGLPRACPNCPRPLRLSFRNSLPASV